jgi:hypothetical protein
MDVHGQSTTLVVLGPSGRKLKEQVLETRGAVLREALRALGRPRYLCMEEGMFSQWLYEELCDAVDELVVSQPSRHHGTKSDSVDAHRCADALRRDALERVVYKTRPGQYTELRLAVRGHQAVMRDHVRAKNRLRAFVRSRGVQANAALYDVERRAPMLLGLPKTHRALAIRGLSTDCYPNTNERLIRKLFEAKKGRLYPLCTQKPIKFATRNRIMQHQAFGSRAFGS